jgi:hypothetical protein
MDAIEMSDAVQRFGVIDSDALDAATCGRITDDSPPTKICD